MAKIQTSKQSRQYELAKSLVERSAVKDDQNCSVIRKSFNVFLINSFKRISTGGERP